MEPATTAHEAIDHNELPVHTWRVAQLTRLGIPGLLAEIYSDHLDWHQIARSSRTCNWKPARSGGGRIRARAHRRLRPPGRTTCRAVPAQARTTHAGPDPGQARIAASAGPWQPRGGCHGPAYAQAAWPGVTAAARTSFS
jgi:hypothetical protein